MWLSSFTLPYLLVSFLNESHMAESVDFFCCCCFSFLIDQRVYFEDKKHQLRKNFNILLSLRSEFRTVQKQMVFHFQLRFTSEYRCDASAHILK